MPRDWFGSEFIELLSMLWGDLLFVLEEFCVRF